MAWAIFSMLFLAIGGVVYGAAALIWFALTILANSISRILFSTPLFYDCAIQI